MAYPRPAYFAGNRYPATRGLSSRTPAFTPSPSNAPTSTVTSTVPFDYQRYLAVDPTLRATLRQLGVLGLAQQTALAGGAGQLYGRLGELPTKLSPELVKLLGPQLADLRKVISEGNLAGTSTLAQLQHTYDVNQSGDVGSLVGRGMLHSGALGQYLNDRLREYTLGGYNARQAAADSLSQLQQTYLSGQTDLAGKAGTAVSQAQQRASDLINLGQLGPYTTTRTVTNPYLNPAAPRQVSTGVTVGGTTSFEPHATAGNILPAAPSAPKPPAPTAAPYRPPAIPHQALR